MANREVAAVKDAIKECNEKLIDATELTNSIIETVPESVLVLAADLRVLMANRFFYSTFDTLPEATLNHHIYDMGDGQWDKPDLRVLLSDVLSHGKDFLNHQVEFEFPDSVRKTFMASGRQMVQDRDAAPLILLSLADITLPKNTEAALIQAEKLSIASRLAASIAHEINNPLHAVTNLLYLASIGDDLAATKSYASRALQEILHVGEITKQTLKLYGQTTVPSSVEISEVLDALLLLYHGKLTAKSISVKRRYREAPPILCLEGDIRQIFANIIGNAVDAMNSRGTLAIGISQSHDWRKQNCPGTRITIADSGIGMDAATQLKMCKPFFSTKTGTGTGFGMWVSAQLVERLRGDLRVWSTTRPGRSGTALSLFFPLDRRKGTPTLNAP
jgi:two-component system, chemotaxis family, CheB/CheR fusion protein